jgi:hypothetical protein
LSAHELPILTVAPEPHPRARPVATRGTRNERIDALPDATNEARSYLAIHHVDLAIETLRRHVDSEERTMPVAWLMLLDLYRTHGREQAFRDLAERFHQRFNAQQPDWDRYPPDGGEPGLEAFPRLIKEITLSWGTHECRRLLDRLLYDNRNGCRMGFTLNAYNDLIALRRVCEELLATIEADLAEEASVRAAFAAAKAELAAPAAPREGNANDTWPSARTGLACELEAQLCDDLRAGADTRSPLELEQPALAGMLVREWGNSALAARLCEILAQGALAAHPLSPEAADDLAMLHRIASELAGTRDKS